MLVINGSVAKVTMESFIVTMLNGDMRRKFNDEGSKDALHVPQRPKDKSGSKGEWYKYQSKSRGKSRIPRKIRVKFWKYGKRGQVKKECKKLVNHCHNLMIIILVENPSFHSFS